MVIRCCCWTTEAAPPALHCHALWATYILIVNFQCKPLFCFELSFSPTDIMYQQTYVCLFLLQFIFYSTSLSTIVTLCVQPVSSLPYAISNALQLLKIYLMLDFRIFHRMSLVCEIPYAYMHLCCFSVQPGSGSPRGQPAKAQKPHQSCCQIFASALMCLYDLWIQNY